MPAFAKSSARILRRRFCLERQFLPVIMVGCLMACQP
jgi:hypothetical protein